MKRVLGSLLVLFGTASISHAQATPTASRLADLQVGAGFSNANTDYLPYRVDGFTVYTDFDFTRRFGVEGEFRFLKDGKTNQYEKTYEIGGRYYHPLGPSRKFIPYAKLLYGRGVYNFTDYRTGVVTANLAYNMFAVGVGVDYRVRHNVTARADFEYQKWLSGRNLPNGLSPSVLTLGAAYHF
ncbi:porin family protein [Edaphobacter bradus]|uniref:porin family protein n=1 Tax=Edaphobacter bradus TaxID=2259016 RepID=UPI0021E0F392|nr:porin family protein [Edaphobacter bradus]